MIRCVKSYDHLLCNPFHNILAMSFLHLDCSYLSWRLLLLCIFLGFQTTVNAQCSTVSSSVSVPIGGSASIDANNDGTNDFTFSYTAIVNTVSVTGLDGNMILFGGINAIPLTANTDPICASDNFTGTITVYSPSFGSFTISSGTYFGFKNGSDLGFLLISIDVSSTEVTIDYSQYILGAGAMVGICGGEGIIAGDCSSVTVPVELLSFDADYMETGIELEWITASELDNKGFALERSLDGKDFEEIAWIDGHGTSNEHLLYTFEDTKLPTAKYIYYRLKQIDFGGTFEYSNIVVVKSKALVLEVSEVYPNPVQTTGQISLDLAQDVDGELRIYDMMGRALYQAPLLLTEGANIIDFDVPAAMRSGLLLLEIQLQETLVHRKLLVGNN